MTIPRKINYLNQLRHAIKAPNLVVERQVSAMIPQTLFYHYLRLNMQILAFSCHPVEIGIDPLPAGCNNRIMVDRSRRHNHLSTRMIRFDHVIARQGIEGNRGRIVTVPEKRRQILRSNLACHKLPRREFIG
jgi:hypothetical protein